MKNILSAVLLSVVCSSAFADFTTKDVTPKVLEECQNEILRDLDDPDSTKFTDYIGMSSGATGDVVSVEFRTRNRIGGMVRAYGTCAVEQDSDGVWKIERKHRNNNPHPSARVDIYTR